MYEGGLEGRSHLRYASSACYRERRRREAAGDTGKYEKGTGTQGFPTDSHTRSFQRRLRPLLLILRHVDAMATLTEDEGER